MDAIALLKQDHAELKALFDEYERLGEGAEVRRQAVADRIIRDLSVHDGIEEHCLYPYVKQRDERLSRVVCQSLEEHSVAKWEMLALERLKPGDERFDAKMAVLMESVRHHIEEEEEKLFPRLSQICDRAELEALGDTLKHSREAAPTHPHPRAPDEPPGNAMAPVLAAMDRGRDLASVTFKRSRALVESTLERGRELVRGQRRKLAVLRREAKALSRKASKRAAVVAREAATTVQPKRKTVARVTASMKRSGRTVRKTVARAIAPRKRTARSRRS